MRRCADNTDIGGAVPPWWILSGRRRSPQASLRLSTNNFLRGKAIQYCTAIAYLIHSCAFGICYLQKRFPPNLGTSRRGFLLWSAIAIQRLVT
ncbi:hypothetical protein [Nostoc sp. ATCC 53789]|uniref:hypothetical protein n=1 Tax=Nostoc sp. ATCC 53789 TaxID=76335 RepID=UPI0011BE3097|nr:hypothetical protein [Nostoc sp. ATCC 53789]QHG20962.1 hypothetical protein GJB62_34465 [Nostoc sp. ATCC 53789]